MKKFNELMDKAPSVILVAAVALVCAAAHIVASVG
jgi:hypothetical protein